MPQYVPPGARLLRDWITDGCMARGCTGRAQYLDSSWCVHLPAALARGGNRWRLSSGMGLPTLQIAIGLAWLQG